MSKAAYEIIKLECLPVDQRIIERNLAAGVVSRKDYDKYLSSLEDLVDQTEEIQVTVGPEDDSQTPSDDEADDEADEASDPPSA